MLENEQNSTRASGIHSGNKENEQYNKMFKVLSETANEKLNNLENDGKAQGERNPPGKWTEQGKQITKCPENASISKCLFYLFGENKSKKAEISENK